MFKTKTRDEWCEIMEGTDVCFAPVLSLAEAPSTRTTSQRGTFVERNGVVQPAPAPRFSRTPGESSGRRRTPASTPTRSLADWGLDAATDRQAARTARSAAVAGPRPRQGRPGAPIACPAWPRSSASTPIPTTSRIATGGTMAKAAPPATASCSCRHPGRAGRAVPGVLGRGRAAVAAAGAGDAPLGRDPRRRAGRVPRLRGLGDDGRARATTNPACFWQADVDEAAERLAAILREEDADVLTIYDDHGGYGHPDHIQVHRVGSRAAELAGRRRASSRRR